MSSCVSIVWCIHPWSPGSVCSVSYCMWLYWSIRQMCHWLIMSVVTTAIHAVHLVLYRREEMRLSTKWGYQVSQGFGAKLQLYLLLFCKCLLLLVCLLMSLVLWNVEVPGDTRALSFLPFSWEQLSIHRWFDWTDMCLLNFSYKDNTVSCVCVISAYSLCLFKTVKVTFIIIFAAWCWAIIGDWTSI